MSRRRLRVCQAFLSVLLGAFILFLPVRAHAAASPWGAGTTYNAKTHTLVIKRGAHTIKGLSKTYKRRYVYIDRLIVRGGTVKVRGNTALLSSLTVSGGKLASTVELSVSGKAAITGGTVSISNKGRYGSGLRVSDDLVVKGGRLTVKTVKEGCSGISVYGDMIMRKGLVTVTTKGKSAEGLGVSGYLKVTGGTVKVTTAGKYATAVRVYGDYIQSGGAVSTKASRDDAIQCSDRVSITGGKASASSAKGSAISSGEPARILPGCLGSVRGTLPAGAHFKVGGFTYCVRDVYKPSVTVSQGRLQGTVTFGGVKYTIVGLSD